MTRSLVTSAIQKCKVATEKEQKNLMLLVKTPRLKLFLSKSVFTWELSELLRDEFGSFERKVCSICGKPHTSARVL